MEKFIRCFCYGLEPGETVVAQVEGQAVTFTYSTAQVDVVLAPTVEASIPAPSETVAPDAPAPVPAPAPAPVPVPAPVEEAPAPAATVEDPSPAPAPVSSPTE